MHDFKDYDIISLTINGKVYKLWVADTFEKKKIGLSNVRKLPKNRGMIFIYDKPSNLAFTMRETSIPLKIIFLNEMGGVIDYHDCKPFQKNNIVSKSTYRYVIEI